MENGLQLVFLLPHQHSILIYPHLWMPMSSHHVVRPIRRKFLPLPANDSWEWGDLLMWHCPIYTALSHMQSWAEFEVHEYIKANIVFTSCVEAPLYNG